MYDELVKALHDGAEFLECSTPGIKNSFAKMCHDAADAIEELLKAARAMHTWIFLNSVDEQAAYDECGLTDEMNMVLGYGGQFVAEMSKDGDA